MKCKKCKMEMGEGENTKEYYNGYCTNCYQSESEEPNDNTLKVRKRVRALSNGSLLDNLQKPAREYTDDVWEKDIIRETLYRLLKLMGEKQ